MNVKREFQIYAKTHRSGNPGWVVSLGKVNGIRKFEPFATLEEAQHFRAQCMEKDALKHPTVLADLSELHAASMRMAMAKLKPYDASIVEAADYFIKFAKPPKGNITIREAIDLFKNAKKDENASEKYIKDSSRCFFVPFMKAFNDCEMNGVTDAQAYDYIYKNTAWNTITKGTHIRHLRAFYNFVIGKDYATRNPFLKVPFPKDRQNRVRTKIVSVESAKALLEYALAKGYKAECASMALVFFCGVRVTEVSRLTWERITLDGAKPTVEIDIDAAKKNARRINRIPENALHWLRACQSAGNIAPENYEKRMQRLRKKVKVPYPQNAARHSFASYHVALHEDGLRTAFMLGHPSPTLLYSTYRELVTSEAAAKYWEIVPDFVIREREATALAEKQRADTERAEREREEMEEAQSQSNRGIAVKDESGRWCPVMDENAASFSHFEDELEGCGNV